MARKPAAQKPSPLVASVLKKVCRSKPGFRSWFEVLPKEAQEQLEAARAAFDPRIHQKKPYARAIIEAAQEFGWETSGVQGVLAWLTAKSR